MRKMLVCLLICTLVAIMGVNSYAGVPDTVMPLYDNISRCSPSLSFDGGSGTAKAVVSGKSGTTEIEITMIVYRETGGGGESFVDSVTETFDGAYASLSLDFDAEAGETYRASVRVTVTRNGVDETELFIVWLEETCM